MKVIKQVCVLLVFVSIYAGTGTAAARRQHHHRHHIARKAGWAGAGFAAGKAVGPAGSAAVGVAKYRRDLKAGGHRSRKAAAKIGAPIAAGLAAGPAGTVGYEAVAHRHWIKRKILGRSHKHRNGN